MRIFKILLISITTISLLSCASTPNFDISNVNHSLTPKSVTSEINTNDGKIVLWGGVILLSKNLKQGTQIEVLAYPLDSDHMPLRNKDPLGRFIIQHNDYLETKVYTEGRMISVVGNITKNRTGKVGEADYVYPVVISKELHLWGKDSDQNKTSFHFGLGIRL